MPGEGKIFKTSEEVRMLNRLKETCVEVIEECIQKVCMETDPQKDTYPGDYLDHCIRNGDSEAVAVRAAMDRLLTEYQRILNEIKEPLEGVGRSLEQCAALLEAKEGGQEDE